MPQRLLALAAALLLWTSLAWARLDINTATAEQLDGLKGIGPVKARAIVDYRREHGAFRAVDDLQQVPGLGPAIVNGFRREVTVGATAGAAGREPPSAADRARGMPAPARPATPGQTTAKPAAPRAFTPAAPARPANALPPAASGQPPRPATPPAAPALPPLVRPDAPASVPPVAAPARPPLAPTPPRPAMPRTVPPAAVN